MRERRRREMGSRRCVFQPVTRSKPSSSFARRRGISAGSSCRAPSIGTTTEITGARLYAGRGMAELLSLEEALERILERVTPLGPEDVDLSAAAGRVLAEDARAVVDLPPFPSSAMDGFAVRSGDTPGRLPIVARIAAGVPAERGLEAGEAMAIATGGVVPVGADSVIPIEDVVEDDNSVEIPGRVGQGDNVRPRGGDVAAGSAWCRRAP